MAGSYLVYSFLGGMFVSSLPCSVFCLLLDTVRIVYGPYHMAGGTLGPTLASGSLGQYVRCRPMCLQRIHYSVSLALWVNC